MPPLPSQVSNNPTIFLVLVFSSLLLLVSSQTTKALEPVELTLRWVVKPITFIAELPTLSKEATMSYFVALDDLRTQNTYLSQQVSRMNSTYAELNQAKETIKELSIALDYRQSSPRQYQIAEVIDYVPLSLRQEVVINIGRQHGVQQDDVVLDSWGLYGRVLRTFSRASQVMLLSDERHATPVLVKRTRHYFIASGTGSNQHLLLDNVNLSADLQIGDVLVTSGLGGVFPEGIEVGRIDSVTDNVAEYAKVVTVKPYARLSAKSYLHVIEKDSVL